jgi:RHS repeat-associated protein
VAIDVRDALIETSLNFSVQWEDPMRNDQKSGSAEQAGPNGEGAGDRNQISPPAISLPKGGGAIRGIDEKFQVNPATGSGAMTVPIATSPGRQGFGPQLALSYDSGSGNGPFGLGWSLSTPNITRKTGKGLPRYRDATESDVYLLSGAEDLVPVYRQDPDRSWIAGHPGYRRDPGEFWVRDQEGHLVIHEDELDGYRVRRYRPRTEGLFARIERWTNRADPADTFWRSISKENITTWYGKTAESRIADPADPSHIFSWLICESYEDKGNAIVYKYKAENSAGVHLTQTNERNRTRSANRYLKRIQYGNVTPRRPNEDLNRRTDWMFEVVFDYGEGHVGPSPGGDENLVSVRNELGDDHSWPSARLDPFSTYRAGFEVRTYRLCRQVLMFHHFVELGRPDTLVRSTEFSYDERPILTYLRAVTHAGYLHQNDDIYRKKSMPPVEFEYSQVPLQDGLQLQDMVDFDRTDEEPAPLRVQEIDPASLENLPIGLDGGQYRFVDLDGEGLSGILTEQGRIWFYKPNLGGGRFGPMTAVAEKPSLAALNGGRQQLLDLAGDGQLDLALLDGPNPGFYERTLDSSWHPFRPFETLPNVRWDDPNLRFVDLTGDGHTDLLVAEDQVFFSWYLSLAEVGFAEVEQVSQPGDEEQGPRLVFADASQSIYLADLSGDGLTDLARIRNGEVCYWPNLGYGRFGAKVTMDNAPWFDRPDLFDQRRIRLADIDGSGTTDILYLAHDSIGVYRNQAGNGWSDGARLTITPDYDNMASVQVTDLLGTGTACLVWSSPLPGNAQRPLRYIDLMNGTKPHLLIRSWNNLGAETVVQYAPSTKFYLADKAAGAPWITRLPFPVYVVERRETWDHISRNRFVARYAYHHGYFDGEEREFRGFGLVEQWDTEEFAALEADGLLEDAENLDEASHVPPVYTKSWFHTGIYLGRNRVSNFFAGLLDDRDRGEYYREPAWRGDDEEARQHLLDDTVLPPGLRAEEAREACRALKGSMLRQEIYALDGSPQAPDPYVVTEQNFTVKALQPRGPNRHAVFFTHPHEAISYHYERNPADPRVSHALTLEVDQYGNVLKSAAIGYGRRQDIVVTDEEGNPTEIPDPDLIALVDPNDQKKQTETLITYTESRFTVPEDYIGGEDTSVAIDEDDNYRVPLPCETRTYQLTGLTPPEEAQRFTFTAIETATATATFLDYHRKPDPDGSLVEKRLLEHVRTLYRRNDLGDHLPLGRLASLALPYESYRLAITPDHLSQVLDERVTDAILIEGGYVQRDGNWWIPSGRMFYSPEPPPANPADLPAYYAREVIHAHQHFFLTHRVQDPFGHSSYVSYDAHDLLIVQTIDPVGNQVTARNDYRLLQPDQMTDPNNNRTQVAFDTLGLVAATAVMGKEGGGEGDRLPADYDPDLTQADIDAFFSAPRGPTALRLLDSATSRIVYDVTRFQRLGQPAVAATMTRETHVSDLEDDEDPPFQVGLAYSDGFGRVIQSKGQAEPGRVEAGGPVVDERWVGSGWTIFNNKGKPVRQYEPFFSDTPDFEFARRQGVSPILFYDPVGRVVATLHPNHTYEKVLFDPWRQESWDVNDTVLLPPQEDPDVGDYFRRLPADDYRPTWHELRTDAGLALAEWPDRDPVTGEDIPHNAQRRRQEREAARKTAVHAGTPTVAHFDSLGRPCLTMAQNRFERDDTIVEEPPNETRVELDLEGNQLYILDARNNAVMVYATVTFDSDGRLLTGDDDRPVTGAPGWDIAGRQLYTYSMDAGERWLLPNVTGKPIRAWDNRGHTVTTHYDELQRPTHYYVQPGDDVYAEQAAYPERAHLYPVRLADPGYLVERIVYGESLGDSAGVNNLRGQVYQHFDAAGVLINMRFDFKGNLLQSSRQLLEDYRSQVNWETTPTLEEPVYTTQTRYDALNRPIQVVTPHDGHVRPNVIQPDYNEANLLERVDVWLRRDGAPTGQLDPDTADMHAVTDIDYNARGQRIHIVYGNEVATTYTYDDHTFRLTNLTTIRPDRIPADRRRVQDLLYVYDPVGNITSIRDDAQQTVFFANTVVEPSLVYRYDALYRLIHAEGREHARQHAAQRDERDFAPVEGIPFPNSPEALLRYVEEYVYDSVGNIKQMAHRQARGDGSEAGRWTRYYDYEEANNRLRTTSQPGDTNPARVEELPDRYTYNVHGSMVTMPHLPLMQWDYQEQLRASSQQVRTDGDAPEITYYVYNAAGQRVRKVTERQAAPGDTPRRMKERLYLGGFEIYREYNGNGATPTLGRETLHIMNDQQRIALAETRTEGDDGSPRQLVRYQLSNHLGSACVELSGDAAAAVISYEEYHPYGTTAYQAKNATIRAKAKRYRYTGMERDEETGLNYHTARYYAPWLGRWTSCDPAVLLDGVNLFGYVRGNPLRLVDKSGEQASDPRNPANYRTLEEFRAALSELDSRSYTYEEADRLSRAYLGPAPDTVDPSGPPAPAPQPTDPHRPPEPPGPWAPDLPPGEPYPYPGPDPLNPQIPRPPRPPRMDAPDTVDPTAPTEPAPRPTDPHRPPEPPGPWAPDLPPGEPYPYPGPGGLENPRIPRPPRPPSIDIPEFRIRSLDELSTGQQVVVGVAVVLGVGILSYMALSMFTAGGWAFGL